MLRLRLSIGFKEAVQHAGKNKWQAEKHLCESTDFMLLYV